MLCDISRRGADTGASFIAALSCPAERNLRFLMDKQLKVTQVAKQMVFWLVSNYVTRRSRENFTPLYSARVRPYLEYCVQFLGTSIQERD